MRRLRALIWLLSPIFAGCTSQPAVSDVLLFNGQGTSANDVAALKDTLRDAGVRYTTANSAQLDAFGASDLRRYRLLLVPGGNFEAIGKGLSARTSDRIRDAIESGLNYLGVCAG